MNELLLKRLEHLSPERRELVLKKLSAANGQGDQASAIPRISRDQALPLSSAQTRLWFLDQQLGDRGDVYNSPLFLRLDGPLQVSALERAIADLVQRHEILRTTFSAIDGSPIQVIAPSTTVPLTMVDLLALPETEALAETRRLANEALTQRFDLTYGPLIRVTLLHLNRNTHVLLIVMHHIVSDGWSAGVLNRELAALYTAHCAGEPSPLPDLPIQYADFAHWQQQQLNGEELQRQRHYWQQQLAGAPALLELPADRPRPAVPSHQGRSEMVRLDWELTQHLRRLSQASEATLFMTLLSGFLILLSRYCRREDIVVGTAIANRTRQELESLIGFFVNTLVLRIDLQGDPSFTALLKRVRQVTLDAYGHQDFPFEKLVDDLQPERSLSYHPLFQVVLGFQNAPGQNPELAGLTTTPFEWENTTTHFDLAVMFRETDAGLIGGWEYNTDLFERATIQRMAGHLEVLLRAIAARPDEPISTLPMMTPVELKQLQNWNQTGADASQYLNVVDLFEQQVERAPDHIALVLDEQRLTYRQLNERANQLAHALRRLQAGRMSPTSEGWLVALCVERSLDMVIALLGILKSGGAYIPIDPTYPPERIRFMLEDAAAPVVLTQTGLKDYLPLGALEHPCEVLCLDENPFVEESTDNLGLPLQPEDLAYVIYTSGSTGRPKGVLLVHQGLSNLTHTHIAQFELQSDSRMLQFASFSFDASVWETFMALGSGARLVLGTPASLRPGRDLWQTLDQLGITHVVLPPSTLAVMPTDDLPALSHLIVGGEACPPDLVRRWANGRRFFNAYGPTESTVCTSIARCEPNGRKPPIGQPVANLRVYILDDQHHLLPPRIPGELCIAGVGLARGYLNRPELTAEKFIHLDLLGVRERIYKTGDLARWLPDGQLEFLGRIDHQVKLRGFRIELGEIESLLSQHPTVRDAVVVTREASASDQQLHVYVVPRSENGQTADEETQQEQVEVWQHIFDETYRLSSDSENDPTLNIVGWQDSYTGEPIVQADMREWRDATVARVLSLQPKRVWEIGCGTGMLLFHIAPHCQQYLGTDMSAETLNYVAQHLESHALETKVHLRQCAADRFDGIEPKAYDLVMMNSVVQYFPSLDYLDRVLTGAIDAVAPGGAIFIGDVRNLRLLEIFHTAVQAHRAPNTLPLSELRQRIQRRMHNEEELLIDPDFFITLPQRSPRVSRVHIELKWGDAHTDMTRFRYDVTLYLDRETAPVSEPQWLDWQSDALSPDVIQNVLTTQQPDLLGIQHIPNARLASEMLLFEQVVHTDGTMAELNAALRHAVPGVEPDVFRRLTQDLPYTPFIQYDPDGHASYQIILQRDSDAPATPAPPARFVQHHQVLPNQPGPAYANNPLQYRLHLEAPDRVSEWRDFLQHHLPDYMIPSHFTVLEALPTTPNGKIDRNALPAPDLGDKGLHEAPRTEIEQQLMAIWSEVLNRQDVGIHDNFFEMGGHSVLAVKLLSDIEQRFHIQLQSSVLFESPTIAQLADQLGSSGHEPSTTHVLSIQPAGDKTPLFCVPGANGYAFYFRDLAMHLGTDQPLYGLETPGLDDDSPLPDSVESHASQLLTAMCEQQASGPYLLVGYSAGCAVAFEMARQLELQGETVGSLIILDSGLVSNPEYFTQASDLDQIWQRIRRIEHLRDASLGLDYQQLAQQPDDRSRWLLYAEHLHRRGALPEYTSLAQIQTSLEVSQALTHNYATYLPTQPIAAPIVLYRTNEIDAHTLAGYRSVSHYDQPDWGWQSYTEHPVQVRSVPGNHRTMIFEPHVSVLAAELRGQIALVQP